MELGNVIQCLGCGATNKLPFNEDVMCCSYCGGFIERKHQTINPIESSEVSNSQIKDEKERQEMIDAIMNDPLVRSVYMPKKSPMYIQLPISFCKAFGFKGVALITFGLFVLFHLL